MPCTAYPYRWLGSVASRLSTRLFSFPGHSTTPIDDMPDWLRKFKDKDNIRRAKDAARTAVAIAREALAPIPPAQAVFASLLLIIDEIEVSDIPIETAGVGTDLGWSLILGEL